LPIHNPHILPPSTIGIVGGGQLGMMTVREAHRMGYRTVVWDPDPRCPASRLADEMITAPFDQADAASQFSALADVITYEFENINAGIVALLEQFKPLYPGSSILSIAQHRREEKQTLQQRGFPVVPFAAARGGAEIRKAVDEVVLPVVVKTATAGYDGKGQTILRTQQDVERLASSLHETECVVEKFLDLERELSVIVARGGNGTVVTFPIPENDHRNNILHTSVIPARLPARVIEDTRTMACDIMTSFNLVGILCVEMFLTVDGKLLVNELAPRPHNSGHFSLDACSISQFEMLVRTICGLPIPTPSLLAPCAMVNVLGKHLESLDIVGLANIPGTKLHLYGKNEARPHRKMGHITILAQTQSDVLTRVALIEKMIGEDRLEVARLQQV
jgi:5-(carboxyamino)imidazole ribonucleotide synthase